MNIKLKMTFIIIITLAIGIVIGAMLNRTISQRRIRNILLERRPDMFVRVYERILEPNSAQSKAIREILNKYAQRNLEIRTKFREETQSVFESMKTEIEPILTPGQKKRLENRLSGRGRFPVRRRPLRNQRNKY